MQSHDPTKSKMVTYVYSSMSIIGHIVELRMGILIYSAFQKCVLCE